MLRPSLTIAGYTVLEALRNRLLWLFALMAVAAVARRSSGLRGQHSWSPLLSPTMG